MALRKQTGGQAAFNAVNYTLLTALGFATLYPFIYFLALSFNDGKDALKGGIYFWPRQFTLDNYMEAFQNADIFNAFGISVFRTLAGTLISLVLTTMVAYALTKKKLPGRTVIVFFFFFTTIFSGGMIPFYILLRELGLTKSVWIYVLPFLFNFFNIVIVRTFFDAIPSELAEAASIDGCSDLRIYWRIYLPLSGPVIATIALFFGVMHWNDWFTGAMYVTNQKLIPAATLLQQIINEASFETTSGGLNQTNALLQMGQASTTPEALRMTFLVITTLPIVCVYPFLQKYFVKGVMVGSVKG